ncbi:hypothetical protein QL285_060575 [Trifolium repens]|nr:hypothetical protein QL285_060575 [Trifolium repens]
MTLLILDLILEQNPLKTLASFSLTLLKKQKTAYIGSGLRWRPHQGSWPRPAPGRQSPQAKLASPGRLAPSPGLALHLLPAEPSPGHFLQQHHFAH